MSELEQQVDQDQEQSSEPLSEQDMKELEEAGDLAVLWTEQHFNVRFVE